MSLSFYVTPNVFLRDTQFEGDQKTKDIASRSVAWSHCNKVSCESSVMNVPSVLPRTRRLFHNIFDEVFYDSMHDDSMHHHTMHPRIRLHCHSCSISPIFKGHSVFGACGGKFYAEVIECARAARPGDWDEMWGVSSMTSTRGGGGGIFRGLS